MPEKWRDICDILASMNADEVEAFLFDLTSSEERSELSRRFEVAQMLQGGKSYKQIEKDTGMSSTTIARISRFLGGEKGGYRRAFEILGKKEGS